MWKRIRSTCAKGCRDDGNPYARAGAACLARELGGFEAELAVLRNDQTPTDEWGNSVSSYSE
jgi:hypothetical protein